MDGLPAPLKLRPYGAIQMCILLLLFEVSISTPYEDMKGDTKYQK